ncbi:uncharacterized protein [Haliotis cracherodii]|uniref:uncharacterized protein n=1 Tax=Haliotis cracherodii TaxID=6455 RepID=UPI0039E86EA6
MWLEIDMIEVHTISSSHLTTAQCDILKYIVGRRREIRAAGVVEVLTADVTDAGSRTWTHRGYGVMCFIKDHPRKQYIFKAFNLMTRQEIHEHTINNKFKYIEKSDRFHYMTGAKNRMTGLNFIDESEASAFKETVDRKREQWTFPSVPPHPCGLPDYIPPHITLQEIIQELPQEVPSHVLPQTPTQVPTLVPHNISSQTPQDILAQDAQDTLTPVPQNLFTQVPQEVPSQVQSQVMEQDLTSQVSQEITSQVSQEITSQAPQGMTSQSPQEVQSHVSSPVQPQPNEKKDVVASPADPATHDRLDDLVTERQLMTLSTAFGDNWQCLSVQLGISCREELTNGDNTTQQKMHSVLKEWVRVNAQKATSRVFLDAIHSVKDAGLVTVDMDVVHKACNFKEESDV